MTVILILNSKELGEDPRSHGRTLKSMEQGRDQAEALVERPGSQSLLREGLLGSQMAERRLLPPLSSSATLHFFRLTAHACAAASQALCGKGLVLFISADLTLMGSPRS